jgi:hypothetical protein
LQPSVGLFLLFFVAFARARNHLHVKGAVVIRTTRLADRPFAGAIAMPFALAEKGQHP